MNTRISNSTPIQHTSPVTANDSSSGATTNVTTLPPPNGDSLATMIPNGDIGSAIAAMEIMTQKQNRDIAKSARDASYKAMESAQQDQLQHMDDAAQARFFTGLTQGAFEFGSAGASFASAANVDDKAYTANCQGVGECFHASGTVAGAVGRLWSDQADRAAKADEMRADQFKRNAQDSNDDVGDAKQSIQKATQFYQDWVNAKNAERAAILHGS